MLKNKIYLASQSKGRLGILENIGLDVLVFPTDCDESGDWKDPADMVESLAIRKINAFLKSGNYADTTIPAIASDTVVVFGNQVIGKAHSIEEARHQMQTLSGNTHNVYSSYAVLVNNHLYHGYDVAEVVFKDNSKVIESYLASNEWCGAAGSYRVQGLGAELIKEIRGDINTVIGLPLEKIRSFLSLF